MLKVIYSSLLFLAIIANIFCENQGSNEDGLINAENEGTESNTESISETTEAQFTCKHYQTLVDGECVDNCYIYNVCGNNTDCSSEGYRTVCFCKRGFTGNPLKACFKMNEKSPCDPNPCGPNADCISDDPKIGPHCKCKKEFYDWPPTCREGCKSDSDCRATQICNISNSCEELCDSLKCGDNSLCRVDKVKRTINCSCKNGYVPVKDVGCRLKTANDTDISIESFESILNDKCNNECGQNAYCGPEDKCICTDGFFGIPKEFCKYKDSKRTDPCTPNPCGGYSKCKVVDNEAKCSCIRGYGDPPYCGKCLGNVDCKSGDICVNGRCVFNVCIPHCGDSVVCGIYEKKLECVCPIQGVNSYIKPYEYCPSIGFISAAVIAALSG